MAVGVLMQEKRQEEGMENRKMGQKELEFLIAQGEGIAVEFKEGFDAKGIAKEMTAFANTGGGRIFIGISDDGVVRGLEITNGLKAQIQDTARGCDPAIHINLEALDSILVINVEEGINKPYRCSQGFFLRQGGNSQKLSTDEIRAFFNKEGRILFDEAVHPAFGFENGFDKRVFEAFLQRAKLSRLIPDEDILRNLGVLTETGRFKNAGVLFFCSDIEKFFRHAIITCVLYKGTDKYKILDRKDFAQDAVSNYVNTIGFLFRNLRLEYKIETAGPREEVLEVPEDALREAIINAITHRDYNEKGANIQIDVFDDRIEIGNPGGLVPAIKKEEFGRKSVTRNPLLFSLFKTADLVEKVGSGVERMKNAMKLAKLPGPKFEFTDFFTVTFQRPPAVEKGSEKGSEKILGLISGNNRIGAAEIAGKLGISQRAVEKHMSKLKEQGILKRVGPDRGGHWEIMEGTK